MDVQGSALCLAFSGQLIKIVTIAVTVTKSAKAEMDRGGIQTQVWVAPEPMDLPGCALKSASLRVYTLRDSYVCVSVQPLRTRA